ncbi:MAG: hypothetical protein HC804_04485 [Anaerolineae bacterium]|nr:hypothetical protein [Anaerolineae bacterium]
MGSLIGAIAGIAVGGLLGGWPLAYVGFVAGCVLGCIGGALHCLENGWQLRSISMVFGGALLGLLIGPLLVLPVGQLFGSGNLLVVVITAAIGLMGGAMLGIAFSTRLVRSTVPI